MGVFLPRQLSFRRRRERLKHISPFPHSRTRSVPVHSDPLFPLFYTSRPGLKMCAMNRHSVTPVSLASPALLQGNILVLSRVTRSLTLRSLPARKAQAAATRHCLLANSSYLYDPPSPTPNNRAVRLSPSLKIPPFTSPTESRIR